MSTCVLASTERTAPAPAPAPAHPRCGCAPLLTLLLLLCTISGVCGLGGGGGGGLGAAVVCARTPGLAERQRAMCRAAPAAMPLIADGLRSAFAECRAALAGRRWNCSGVGDENLFAHIMPIATREAAFTYAIASAGVTHALSSACARGDLPACGCNNRRRMSHEQWEWGGGGGARCGEAAYGARLARRFLDAREMERDARALMNLHNNRVGRKTVKELVRRECKCHGVSGSCAVRTCWRALPTLRAVAAALLDKYRRARQVTAHIRGTTVDGRVNIQLFVKRARGAAGGRLARKSELVYLAASPSYCEAEAGAGSLGTHQRACNGSAGAAGDGSCAALCCGRGHSARTLRTVAQCRCTFHWCCRVRCDLCTHTHTQHYCN